jgi:hypothetical protein
MAGDHGATLQPRENPAMSTLSTTTARIGAPAAAVALAVILVGCGSGASKTTLSNTTNAQVSTAPRTAAVAPRLLILTPRRGSHTGQSPTVRVGLSGANPTGRRAFRYLLDGRIARLGSARLTFHELAPGRHRLLAMLAADGRVHASSFFVVRAPAPAKTSESAPTMATTTPTPEPAPASAPAPRETPPSTGGIPQNNGGDQDSDNNGAPSDGDGNV